MRRGSERALLGALALVTAVGCGAGTPEEEQQQAVKQGLVDRPDFIITQVMGPTSVQSGQSLTAQVTACNQGTLADISSVGLYLSADTIIRPYSGGPFPPEDTPVGSTSFPLLAPGQCVTVSVTGNAYPPPPQRAPGTYFLGAVVDPYNYSLELREDNNTRVGHPISITP